MEIPRTVEEDAERERWREVTALRARRRRRGWSAMARVFSGFREVLEEGDDGDKKEKKKN